MNAQIIKPTVGRVVLLHVAAGASFYFVPYPGRPPVIDTAQPCAATIAHVHSDRLVNVAAVDANGVPFSMTSVTLVQPGDDKPQVGSYCEWMPFQVTMASKVEEMRAAAAKAAEMNNSVRSTPVAEVPPPSHPYPGDKALGDDGK
jgi:hypothetical protein